MASEVASPPRQQRTRRARRTRDEKWMMEVAPGVVGMRLGFVNVYFLGERGQPWVLVDAGLPFSGHCIRTAAARIFGSDVPPAAIVLTHGHFDHVGSLAYLLSHWNVPVFAHELELPYLTGQSAYPAPDPTVGGGLMALLSFLYPRGPIDLSGCVQPLPPDGTVPFMPDWKWLHTPGHTAGHVSLFREADRVLVAGDAIVTARQESALDALFPQRACVHRPPAYYTPDWEAARESAEKLLELEPLVAATGHGLPVYEEALQWQLPTLVREWSRIALPPRGRYLHQPAIMNRQGVVQTPPVMSDWLCGVRAGVVGMILLRMLRRGKRRKR